MQFQFKENANVFTSDEKKVGEIDRVVLDPQTGKVTHLVVQQGFLFTENKVMPVEFVAASSKDRVTLKESVDDFEHLPPFKEIHYLPLKDEDVPNYPTAAAAPLYGYPPTSTSWWAWPGYPGYAG
jgi:sporulation protein YlmC with PRC-barrel domain